jgi:histone acetyltransferase 1
MSRYEKLAEPLTPKSSSYSIAGFCTTYRNFLFSPLMPKPSITVKTQFPFSPESVPTASSLPCRQRISQFLILPPYQEHGHGGSLYKTIYKTLLNDPTVLEITVEDPSEKFDDLRDYCDLGHLRSLPEFTKIKINTNISVPKKGRLPTAKLVDTKALEAVRISQKLAPRQFSRLTEMQLLSTVPSSSRSLSSTNSALNALRAKRDPLTADADKIHRFWQLLTKQRIYKHNKDQLMQLDRLDRIDKLAETLGMLEADYIRLLARFETGPSIKERFEREVMANGEAPSQKERQEVRAERAKRKMLLDEDEDMEDQGNSDGSEREPKRAKQ